MDRIHILNIEDTILKHVAIKRSLEKCRIDTKWIDRAGTAEDGLRMIEEATVAGDPYDLLITDMHFPLNGTPNVDAGMYVIEELKRRGIDMPIVVCSTIQYKIDGIAGCISYNERMGNLDDDIRKMLKSLKLI